MEKNKKSAKAKAAADRAKDATEEKTNDSAVDSADVSAADGDASEKPKAKEDEGADDDEYSSPHSPKSKGGLNVDDKETKANDADGDVSMGQEDEGEDIKATNSTDKSNENGEEKADDNSMAAEGDADDTNAMKE